MNHDSKNIKKLCSMPTGDWNVVPLVLFDAAKNNCPTLTQNEKQLIHSLLLFSIDHQPHASRLSRLVVKKSVSQSLSQTTAFATIPKGRTVALDSDRFGLVLRHKSGISNANMSIFISCLPQPQNPRTLQVGMGSSFCRGRRVTQRSSHCQHQITAQLSIQHPPLLPEKIQYVVMLCGQSAYSESSCGYLPKNLIVCSRANWVCDSPLVSFWTIVCVYTKTIRVY